MKVAVGIFSTPVWTLEPRYVGELRRRFPDVEFTQAFSPAELETIIADAEIAFSSMVRETTLAHARKLRWVHSTAAGVGGSLFPGLVKSDIVLTNSKGVQSASLAEHVLAVSLAWRRRLHTAIRLQTRRTWSQDAFAGLSAPPFADTRVLIVGMGSIGTQAAAMFDALGMRVDGIGRRPREGRPGVESLPSLLHDADITVITAPHTPETDRLFDREMLACMKPGSLLVNIGRGRIVDERALIEALALGRPGGAALDVFEHEPLSPDSPLWDMENVIVTPHSAGFGARFWEGLVELFAANLERWRAGLPLENVVDKQRGY